MNFLSIFTHLTVGEAMLYGSKRGSAHSRDQLTATFNSLVAGILDGDFNFDFHDSLNSKLKGGTVWLYKKVVSYTLVHPNFVFSFLWCPIGALSLPTHHLPSSTRPGSSWTRQPAY